MARIYIRMLRIPFEWLEFTFECFESLSNGLHLNSKAWNPFRMIRICIQMLQIFCERLEFAFEWLEFAFEWFKSRSKKLNLHLNALNHIWTIRIYIWMLGIPSECFECSFKCLESLTTSLNLHSNVSNPLNGSILNSKVSNPFWMIQICTRML